MRRVSVLTFIPKLKGYGAADLSAHLFDECLELSRHFDLVVLVEGVECDDRIIRRAPFKVVRVPSVKVPKLRGLLRCLCTPITLFILSLTSSIDLVYLRTASLHEILATSLTSKSIVLRVGGTWMFEPLTRLRSAIARGLYWGLMKRARLILPYNFHQVKELLRLFPGLKSLLHKVKLIPNAINTARFNLAAGRVTRNYMRRKLSIPPNSVLITFIGVIDERKGVHILLDAWRNVLSDIGSTDAYLMLIGPVNMKLTHVPRNTVIVGPIANKDVPKYLKASDVFVMPSLRGEGVSRAAIEALHAGLPLIITDVGGMRELSEAALTVKPNDPHELGMAISRLIKDVHLRESLSRKASEVAIRFSLEGSVYELVRAVNNVLTR